MADERFPSPGVDARFPSPGTDIEHGNFPEDGRFPSPGVDTRFQGGYGGTPAPVVAWDAVNLGDGITLSNENRTGESQAPGENLSSARSDTALTEGLDYYWEIDVTGVISGNYVIGICTSTKDLNDWLASGADGLGVNYTGTWYTGGGARGLLTDPWVTGDRVCVHYKRSDETIQFRVNDGTWSTPLDVSAATTGAVMYAGANGGAPGNIYTSCFARSQWAHTPPAGAIAIGETP